MKPENPYNQIETCELCNRYKPNLPSPSCIRSGFCKAYKDAKGLHDAWDEGYETCANQPISEQEGWIDFNVQRPTKDGFYLVKTPDFYKNCKFIVAEWNNRAERFYEEVFDKSVTVEKYKLI